jgi:hypothetical protein
MSLFKRSFRSQNDHTRVDKATRLKRPGSTVVKDPAKLAKLQRSLTDADLGSSGSVAPSSIVALSVGKEGRVFAAHEDVLRQAPFFEAAYRSAALSPQSKSFSLPDEEPEVFSAVLEYLYKGDYTPRLLHNRLRDSWELEAPAGRPSQDPGLGSSPLYEKNGGGRANAPSDAVVFLSGVGQHVLRDTAIYCAAERYGLEELKRLSLRKQGLRSGIDVGTILRSAQYAYAHTPDSDSRLRAHYLALIIRCRKTFKRSGTMQAEMERGGSKLFFDLFVAMSNHLDDVIDVTNARSPRTI